FEGHIWAPDISFFNNEYYLYYSVSAFGKNTSCKGPESTYKIIVSRSRHVTGPYTDKAGKDMTTGGGTLLLQGDENWYGVGHNAAYTFDGKDYIVFHGYDAHDNGRSKLIIRELEWDNEDWPIVKNDIRSQYEIAADKRR
ncbi:MAG: family 43 glycosylhydrolase, partial [Dysgonamonadaceae bacterium]